MKKANINSSKITRFGLEVSWSDGIDVLFNPNDLSDVLGVSHDSESPLGVMGSIAEADRRVIVSRTSAQATLSGCSC